MPPEFRCCPYKVCTPGTPSAYSVLHLLPVGASLRMPPSFTLYQRNHNITEIEHLISYHPVYPRQENQRATQSSQCIGVREPREKSPQRYALLNHFYCTAQGPHKSRSVFIIYFGSAKREFYLNSIAPKHPLSSTCFNSNCWNLHKVISHLLQLPLSPVGKGTANLLLAPAVEVNPTNLAPDLVETDVVKALKARPIDRPHPVIGHEEMLLPAHEDRLLVRQIHGNIATLTRLLLERPEGGELSPMREIDLVRRSPRRVLRDEAVFRADYLALEICG